MTRFILVPGGWHGGWAFDAVSKILSNEGHEVQALTLSGLGNELSTGANLERHIDEVVQAIRWRDTRAVLVGHSYGGMVITGAADKESSRVEAIIYADAYVPDNGAWECQFFCVRGALRLFHGAAVGPSKARGERRGGKVGLHFI